MMSNWQGWLYVAAVLIPLAAFTVEVFFIRLFGRFNAYLATAAIATSFVLSAIGLVSALPSLLSHHHGGEHAAAKVEGEGPVDAKGNVHATHGHDAPAHNPPPFAWTGGF